MRNSCLLLICVISGCIVNRDPYYGQCQEQGDAGLVYAVSQSLIRKLDDQQMNLFLVCKDSVNPEHASYSGQYADVYADGYASGYAYYKTTRRWLIYSEGIESDTPQNAYLAGWYEGQLGAKMHDNANVPLYMRNKPSTNRNTATSL